jgi:hypothetical protein
MCDHNDWFTASFVSPQALYLLGYGRICIIGDIQEDVSSMRSESLLFCQIVAQAIGGDGAIDEEQTQAVEVVEYRIQQFFISSSGGAHVVVCSSCHRNLAMEITKKLAYLFRLHSGLYIACSRAGGAVQSLHRNVDDDLVTVLAGDLSASCGLREIRQYRKDNLFGECCKVFQEANLQHNQNHRL